ncbi:MAG: EamA family transporter [Actinomycetota bacterium]
MIFGLGAAIGWGLADLWAAMSGRRIGSGRTVVAAQVTAALALSAIVLVARPDLGRLDAVIGWLLPNALLTAAAYATLYRALELGPVAVVSPVLASYAVIPVLLAVVLLGETLGPWETMGVAVTIAGAVLTSTDIRALRAGTAARPAGLRLAVVSTLLFGVATYVMGWASQRAGYLSSLWFGRITTALVFVIAVAVVRVRSRPGAGADAERGSGGRAALGFAAAVGLVDLLGGLSYVRGAEVGLVSIVTAASATYPVIPVLGGVLLFQERPAANQYVGVAMVIGGLVLLGLG